jgi:hypothetical protein
MEGGMSVKGALVAAAATTFPAAAAYDPSMTISCSLFCRLPSRSSTPSILSRRP